MFYPYDLVTGRFVGSGFNFVPADPERIADATPSGCGLYRCNGRLDVLSHAVDLATGDLVDFQPAAPADHELATWAWDAGVRRWVPVPTLKGLQEGAAAPLLEEIKAVEARVLRAQREAVVAVLAGQQAPAASVDRLVAGEAEIEALRQRMAAIRATSTPAELDLLLAG